MELNKQVVNLELSKKLKELGYPQEGYFWWVIAKDGEIYVDRTTHHNTTQLEELLVSPTLPELLSFMPSGARVLDWCIDKCDDSYTCWLYRTDNIDAEKNNIHMVDGEYNACNCVAKMLIWLVENNYVEFKEKQDGK